ncbi:alpha/beta hydrolase [Asanoa iriomotensis]|uniref:alpha/beta hydrolase n=1 Tax=Asanoa iriomotensis TaxID=234613 RepID=UPI001943C8C0|nr:alpha/beta fold hydrolase [Asanoa iriomotensis]
MTRRRLVGGALAAAATSAFSTAGAGYYFSGELLGVDHTQALVVRVLAVSGDEVTLSRDVDTAKPIALGLLWPDGGARLSASVRVDGDTVVRRVDERVAGELRPGLMVAVDYNVFGTDPKTAFGLDYATVPVSGELGDMPAWLVPPPGGGHRPGVWAIAVHGRGGSRHEALRVLPGVVGAGLTMLVIGYRNDPDAPASPDGFYHLGDTEWRELAAAIRYARDHGATGIVLFGWSMGGGIALTALRRLPVAEAALIRGLVLDSPVLSWNAVIDYQADLRRLPAPITWSAKRFTEWRGRINLGRLDQDPGELTVPALIFVDEADQRVRTDKAHAFASARPELVTLVATRDGGHVASWNVDPPAYTAAVAAFLDRIV